MPTDAQSLFVDMLGECYDGARLANAWLRLELDDGRLVEGLPSDRADLGAFGRDLDHPDAQRVLHIGRVSVPVGRVACYSVIRPA